MLGVHVQALQLACRHDAERTTAATQSPERLGMALRIGTDEITLGIHELDGSDVVRGQAMAAREPADAAAQPFPDGRSSCRSK
jgi:hypothetical protein